MTGPSAHVSWKELDCNDGTPYPRRFVRDGRLHELMEIFEKIRHECGNKPITILSAYRTPEWNKQVGGARFSQHVEGRALDLRPPKGMSNKEFYQLIKANCDKWGITGLGYYKNFVHVDTRLSHRLISWHSNRTKESKQMVVWE